MRVDQHAFEARYLSAGCYWCGRLEEQHTRSDDPEEAKEPVEAARPAGREECDEPSCEHAKILRECRHAMGITAPLGIGVYTPDAVRELVKRAAKAQP